MKPAIYAHRHTKSYCLVDEDSENRMKWKSDFPHRRSFETAVELEGLKPGQFMVHILTDVDPDLITGDCPWGVQAVNESIVFPTPEIMASWPEARKVGSQNYVYSPKICVQSPSDDSEPEYFHEQRTSYSDARGMPLCRGIHIRAAEVMLRLAASWNNFKYDRVTETRAFGGARFENTEPSLPWDKWAFLCAWFWSDWESRSHPKRLTQAQRFQEMKTAGYPHGEKAFEALHRRLFPKPTRS